MKHFIGGAALGFVIESFMNRRDPPIDVQEAIGVILGNLIYACVFGLLVWGLWP